MHFQLKKTIAHALVLSAMLPALPALAAMDDAKLDPAAAPKHGQYVYDSFGRNARGGLVGNCIYTGFWAPDSSTPECDPNLFASPSSPAPAAQAPAQEQQAFEEKSPGGLDSPAGLPPGSAATEESVPEFVSEPEPTDMVPVPPQEAVAGAGEDTIGAPVIFGEDSSDGAEKDDGILAQNVFGDDDSGNAQDESVNEQAMYYEEEPTKETDDGILAQSVFPEEETKEEAVNAAEAKQEEPAQQEEPAKQEEAVAAETTEPNKTNEQAVVANEAVEKETPKEDEAVAAQSQYYDEEEGAPKNDDILAHNVFGDDDSAKQPEETISEPRNAEEGKQEPEQLAQNEAPKQPETKTQESEAKPVTMLPVTVTVEAEPLFDFDKAAIRSDSRKKLDELIGQLKSVKYGEILTVGFADPIGPTEYNQKLSERRASAVKAYLVSKGLPADKIKVEGRGETEEYATYENCSGSRKKNLISCLQPDRRVEVTVTAEKQQ